MSAVKLTTCMALCRECETVYLPAPGQRFGDALPCGHDDVSYMMPAALLSAERDSRFVEWADRNGYLAEAISGLQDEGGHFDPCGCGSARLTLPEEDAPRVLPLLAKVKG